MEKLYAQLDDEIAAHQPICRNRGTCCRFGEFGHALFVTPIELHYFLHHHPATQQEADVAGRGPTSLELLHSQPHRRCPYQQQGRCTARYARPLGCRVFFCESSREGWQQELTEKYLSSLKAMHAEFSVPYAYLEWLNALRCTHGDERA